MDLDLTKKFGRGPRELGGSVDLISHYKLWPHHEFYCKKSLPLSISETKYLHNVVGDKVIKKGEGMELDQLFQNTSRLENANTRIHPFDLDVLGEAFHMRNTTPVDHRQGEKEESKDARRQKKKRKRDKEPHKDLRNHSNQLKDSITAKDKDKVGNGLVEFGLLQKKQDKKTKKSTNEVISNIQSGVTLAKQNPKINGKGKLKITR